MSPRGAGLIVALVLIACAMVAMIAVGVSWPVTVLVGVVAGALALRIAARRPASSPPASTGGSSSPRA
jgi:hypothetical protein